MAPIPVYGSHRIWWDMLALIDTQLIWLASVKLQGPNNKTQELDPYYPWFSAYEELHLERTS